MNKQGKDGIEWCDYTWNPITGCRNRCWYCYGERIYRRFKKSFEPKIYYDRLYKPGKTPLDIDKPSKIFTCSISDLFAPWIPKIWRLEVFNVIGCCFEAGYKHIFQILTKFPYLIEKDMPENVWIGTTITKSDEVQRAGFLRKIKAKIRFISFEPLFEEVFFDFSGFDWLIIGALTGPKSQLRQPKIEWIAHILRRADRLKIPVFMKNNLKIVWKDKLRKEFPEK